MAYRKYRTRGPRKYRRKKNPGGGAKTILLLAILGGGAYAAWRFRGKIKDALGISPSPAESLEDELRTTKRLMAEALRAGDNSTYVALQKEAEVIKLQIEAERDL